MGKKTTIQDIADALGVSRNTVSKAINNSDGIADATREKIVQKAIEMDYKQFSYVSGLLSAGQGETAGIEHKGTIALFNITYLSNSHFASTMMDKIHEEISRLGYSFVINRVSHENIENLTLPKTFDKDQVTAIICSEIFDPAYSDMICSLGIPVLFVDGPARRGARSVQADMLLMDNSTEITRFVTSLIDRGITRIGFIAIQLTGLPCSVRMLKSTSVLSSNRMKHSTATLWSMSSVKCWKILTICRTHLSAPTILWRSTPCSCWLRETESC